MASIKLIKKMPRELKDNNEGSVHPSIPTIIRPQVRIPSTTYKLFQFVYLKLILYLLFVYEERENKHKEAGIGRYLFKNSYYSELISVAWQIR